MANLAIIVPLVLLAMLVREGESVRCWTCSSDLDPACNDPFLAGRPENSLRYNLRNCDADARNTFPYHANSKSVCMKHSKYINNQLIVVRRCTWKTADDYSTYCPSTSNTRYETTSFCETCEYDGCNSATSVGKTLALLAAPLTLLFFK